MNEGVLYRKYRPEAFSDVVGQDHIVTVLKSAIEKKNIAHAYLFAGTRGTGKTSIARIFAREIGCHKNDLYEIDAASNRGIDDVRELREAVRTMPFESPFKVYIIDEVHMLTKEAFNALLKTLEEPPAHVVFILATTELHKLPDTIISRCQVFQFKRPTQKILKDLVLSIAKKEKIDMSQDGAELVALLGDGSFRDTLGILQKVFGVAKGKKIEIDDIARVTGAPRSELVNNILTAITEKDSQKGIQAIQEAYELNIDMRVFLAFILRKMRVILLLRFVKNFEESIGDEFSDTDISFLKNLSTKKEHPITSKTIERFLGAYGDTKFSYLPQLPLELALIDVIGENI